MANGDNSTNLWAWIAGVIAAIIFFILMDIVILPSTKILTLLFGYSIGGIGILIVIIFIVIIIFLIGRAEDRKRVFTLFKGGINKRLNALIPGINLMRGAPEGRELQVLIENKHIIHANVNYTARSEITYRYWAVVKEAVKAGEKLAPIISKFYDPAKLRKDIILYRSGDGTEKTSEGEMPIGWNRYNKEVIKLINDYMEATALAYMSAFYRLKPVSKFKPDAVKFIELDTRARDLLREIETVYKFKYKPRIEAYKSHHILRAFKNVVLTMSNVTGEVFENPQIFARPDKEIIDGETERVVGVAGKGHMEGMEVPTTQVTQYGELVEDLNKQKDQFGELPQPYSTSPKYKKPRRLKNMSDIIDYPHFLLLMKNIELDWRGLAYDIRYGYYHRKSRTRQDYIDALKANKYPEWADLQIGKKYDVTFTNQANDLRALANPGLNTYWGRKNWQDQKPSDLNPYPSVSSLGLKGFLQVRIKTDARNKALAHQYMAKIPADTGATDKIIEKVGGRKVVTKPIGGTLAEEEKKAA